MNPKIMANVGRRSSDYELLKNMVSSGVEIFRLNFAHASNEQLIELKENVKKIKEETGKEVKILQDLCGPRIRIGILPNDIHMTDGEIYSFSYNNCQLGENCLPIDSDNLIKDVKVGHPFYLVNGAIELVVTEIKNNRIYAKVERGGHLSV